MIMSARDRVVGVVSARVEAQAVIAENRRLRAKETLYAGQNRVQPLGAETPIRPRGLQANSGLPIGAPVQFNQGLAAATPRLEGEGELFLADTLFRFINKRNNGFQEGLEDPNGDVGAGIEPVKARYPREGYVQFDKTDPNLSIKALWIEHFGVWKEVPSGGIGLLIGDGPPSDAIGNIGDLYLDIGYPDDSSNTGTEALRLYFKFASYPSSTQSFWYQIGRRAVLGAPTRAPLFDGEMWTTRGGLTYTGWGGVWRRPNRHTYGDHPPDIKQVGDLHTVPTPVGDPVTGETLCMYLYNGTEWAIVGCDCPDCEPAPPEEPDPDDYPISCTGETFNNDTNSFEPNRPFPSGFGGWVCTIKPVI